MVVVTGKDDASERSLNERKMEWENENENDHF